MSTFVLIILKIFLFNSVFKTLQPHQILAENYIKVYCTQMLRLVGRTRTLRMSEELKIRSATRVI